LDKIKFTSVEDEYRMKHGEYGIHFRVSVSSDLPQGLYYLNWNLSEDTEEFDNTK
jgi:methionine-rich copper-binding protein CopC